jgi:biopolymer transport protein ExbD
MSTLSPQTLKTGTFAKTLMARKHKAKQTKRVMVAGLMLTSMVDMFSLLVIFLLQSFSTSPELVMVTKGVVLPISSSQQEIKDAPVLSISEDGVVIDQKRVGSVDEILKNPDPLMEALEKLRFVWQKANPGRPFKGELNLQAHKELSSTVVSQIMGMLPSQAYGSVQLAIVSGAAH